MAALVLRKVVAITTSFKENKYWIPSGRDLGRDATGIPSTRSRTLATKLRSQLQVKISSKVAFLVSSQIS